MFAPESLKEVLLYIVVLLANVMLVSPRLFLNIIRVKKEYNSYIRTGIRIIGLIIIIILLVTGSLTFIIE